MESKKIEIYGVSGKLGSGKNYVAEKILLPFLNRTVSSEKNSLSLALADHFKVDVCVKQNIDYERIFIKKDEESRKILQLKGTEEGRLKYGEDIWINILKTWIRLHSERGVERFVVTDLRFPNEVEFIKKMGGKVIRIHAPKRNHDAVVKEAKGDPEKISSIKNHSSETALDNYTGFDYILYNDYGNEKNVEKDLEKFLLGSENENIEEPKFCY